MRIMSLMTLIVLFASVVLAGTAKVQPGIMSGSPSASPTLTPEPTPTPVPHKHHHKHKHKPQGEPTNVQ